MESHAPVKTAMEEVQKAEKYLSEDASRWKRCLKECGGKGTKEVSCDCLALGGHLRFVIMILKVSALRYLSLASFCFTRVGRK